MKRFLRRHGAGSRARLAEEGLEGTAVIRSVEKTRARENAEGGGRSSPVYEFRLGVTLPGRPPYQVTHRQTGWPEAGQTVVVRVDPEDQENLLIDWLATKEQQPPPAPTLTDMAAPFTAWMPGAQEAPPGRRDPSSILAAGQPGTAKVVTTAPRTGASATGHPLHYVLLEVRTDPASSPFLVELEEGVPPDQAGRLAVGAELPVKIVSATGEGVAIEWTA